jgi:hypothetical protein
MDAIHRDEANREVLLAFAYRRELRGGRDLPSRKLCFHGALVNV